MEALGGWRRHDAMRDGGTDVADAHLAPLVQELVRDLVDERLEQAPHGYGPVGVGLGVRMRPVVVGATAALAIAFSSFTAIASGASSLLRSSLM